MRPGAAAANSACREDPGAATLEGTTRHSVRWDAQTLTIDEYLAVAPSADTRHPRWRKLFQVRSIVEANRIPPGANGLAVVAINAGTSLTCSTTSSAITTSKRSSEGTTSACSPKPGAQLSCVATRCIYSVDSIAAVQLPVGCNFTAANRAHAFVVNHAGRETRRFVDARNVEQSIGRHETLSWSGELHNRKSPNYALIC
jgi:hypothetical protein